MRRLPLLAVVLCCAAAPHPAPPDGAADYLAGFVAAEETHRPFRPITAFDPAASLDQAYAIQHRLVRQKLARGDRVAGYRGGLMSAKSLAGRGVREPLIAVQFRSGRRRSPATIRLSTYRHPAIEMKIGFVFRTAPPAGALSPAQLRAAVATIVPVVDVPDIGYADPAHYSAVDMVAANVSAADYAEGRRSRTCADLDAERAVLTRDGVAVTDGRGSDSLGEIWRSLGMIVALARREGYSIHRGDIVLTGKIGGKVDVRPGDYTATFSCLGPVSVRLVP